MVESKTVAVVPLSCTNYSMWKIQCKMALMKEVLWNIVNEIEPAPDEGVKRRAKFAERQDKALTIIVLAIESDYCVGD